VKNLKNEGLRGSKDLPLTIPMEDSDAGTDEKVWRHGVSESHRAEREAEIAGRTARAGRLDSRIKKEKYAERRAQLRMERDALVTPEPYEAKPQLDWIGVRKGKRSWKRGQALRGQMSRS
jgi:hypothetical protein